MRKMTIALVFWLLLLAKGVSAQIPLDQITIVNSPNVLAWPVTTQITHLDLRATGVHVEFSTQASWPDTLTPGWDGPLQYTLWLFLNVDGRWVGSGIIQFWRGLAENGGNITSENQIARNWVYDARWGALQGRQPAIGERVAFMVSAGNARGVDVHLVAERSNLVEIAFPAAPASFPPYAWAENRVTEPLPPAGPPVAPPVIPPPPVPPTPPVVAPVDLTPIQTALTRLQGSLDQLIVSEATFHADVESKWKTGSEFLLKYIAPAITAFIVGRKL